MGLVVVSAAGVLTGNSAFADEPLFGYVYTTDLLPKGKAEVEQWLTDRHGRSTGHFDLWEGRTELSYGVSDRFQLSLYGNYAKTNTFHNSPGGPDAPQGVTAPPEVFAEQQPGPNDHLHAAKYVGTSVEGIYRILSPYKDKMGLAIYGEPTIGPGLREMETRIIAQKNFLDDQLILAANATIAQELRYLPGDPDAETGSYEAGRHLDKETDINFGFGASYRFRPNWYAGVEFLNEREFAGINPANMRRTNYAYYLGPTLHYAGKKFFATATVLKQMHGAHDYTDSGLVVNGVTNADDFEKYRFRLKVGYLFD